MPVELTADDAVARLAVDVDECRQCRTELETNRVVEVGHTAAGHEPPRRVVHALAGTMGADWDEESAIEFIRGAERIIETDGYTKATGHGIAAYNLVDDPDRGRWRAFSTKEAE